MKHLILIFMAVLTVGSVSAQRAADYLSPAIDTLAADSTIAYTLGATLDDPGTIYFHVAGLKISGNPGGTISYQYALDNDATNWHTMATDTITNGTTDASYEISNFAAKRARITVATNSTTQSGSYRAAISFKRQQ